MHKLVTKNDNTNYTHFVVIKFILCHAKQFFFVNTW